MARVVREGGVACAAIAVIAVLVGWLQPAPDLTAADARRFTQNTLEDIGLRHVRVSDAVGDARYTPKGAKRSTKVWETTATVTGGTVQLKVNQAHGEAVFVDDVGSDGDRLLTDAQFAALGDVLTDPARGRRITRNVAGTVAGLLAAGVAVMATAIIPGRLKEEP